MSIMLLMILHEIFFLCDLIALEEKWSFKDIRSIPAILSCGELRNDFYTRKTCGGNNSKVLTLKKYILKQIFRKHVNFLLFCML